MAVYKRGKTYWFEFVFQGKRIRRTTHLSNLRKAEEYERGYRTALVKGEIGLHVEKKTVPTFKEAIADFLKWVEFERKPNTYIRHQSSSKILLRYFGNLRVDEITAETVEKFVMKRSKEFGQKHGRKAKAKGSTKYPQRKKANPKKQVQRKISPITLNRELGCLKKMLSRLVKNEVLAVNPAWSVGFLPEEPRDFRVLTYAEEKEYLLACPQPLRDFATIMVETGLRPTEVRNLSVKDVVLENGGSLFVRKSKTKAGRRLIPYLSQRAIDILKPRMMKSDDGFIFSGGRGLIDNSHYKALDRSGVAKFRLYDLRHTYATRQVECGTDIATLQELLGHSKIEMTKRYVHPSNVHKADAMRRMENARLEWERQQADKTHKLKVVLEAKAA
jgi:integrase